MLRNTFYLIGLISFTIPLLQSSLGFAGGGEEGVRAKRPREDQEQAPTSKASRTQSPTNAEQLTEARKLRHHFDDRCSQDQASEIFNGILKQNKELLEKIRTENSEAYLGLAKIADREGNPSKAIQ